MDELWKHYTKGKKGVIKWHMLCDSIYNGHNRNLETKSTLAVPMLEGLEKNEKWMIMCIRFLLGIMKVGCSKIDCGDRCTTL
jgi:hypothetical protein